MANLYIVIRSDSRHQRSHRLADISQAVLGQAAFSRSGSHRWDMVSEAGRRCALVAVNCSPEGNYPASLPRDSGSANLVQVSAWSASLKDSIAILDAVGRIAASLGWAYAIEDGTYATLPGSADGSSDSPMGQ